MPRGLFFLPDARHSSHQQPTAPEQGSRWVKPPDWLYIFVSIAQSEVLHVAAASVFSACQPIPGSVGPVPVNWSHFPNCFPSADIWPKRWDPWPSFPHDQEVGSCCIVQCLGLPRTLQSP